MDIMLGIAGDERGTGVKRGGHERSQRTKREHEGS